MGSRTPSPDPRPRVARSTSPRPRKLGYDRASAAIASHLLMSILHDPRSVHFLSLDVIERPNAQLARDASIAAAFFAFVCALCRLTLEMNAPRCGSVNSPPICIYRILLGGRAAGYSYS